MFGACTFNPLIYVIYIAQIGKHTIEQHLKSLQISRTFSIGILSQSDIPRSPSVGSSRPSQPSQRLPIDDSVKPALPSQLLPALPPLLPPAPFTPSHPVFLSLSAFATTKSTEFRQQIERETRSFIQAKLESLDQEETQLRKEVEGIWGAYREGWKEVLSRVNEERRRALPPKSDGSNITSSAKWGTPMSIRDFSPIVRSHPEVSKVPSTSSQRLPPPSTSLLSASLIQTGSHFPMPTRSPSQETTMSRNAAQTSVSGIPNSYNGLSSQLNGTRSLTSSSSSPNTHGDVHFPGAFKRNMDTSVDIASSMAWVQGEEEMRRRFEGGEDGEPRERARKRTSKRLGAVDTKSFLPTNESARTVKSETQFNPESVKQANSNAWGNPTSQTLVDSSRSSPDNRAHVRQMASSSSTKNKRKVTFNVQPEATTVNGTSTKHLSEHIAEGLFNLLCLRKIYLLA